MTTLALTDEHRRFRWRAAAMNSGIGAVLMCTTLKGGILQLAALQTLGMDTAQIAALGAALFITLFIEPLGLLAQYRWGPLQTLRWAYGGRTLLLALLAVVTWRAEPDGSQAALFCVLIVLLNALHILGFNACWPPIMRACTTPQTRVDVIALIRQAGSAVVLAFTLVTVAFQGSQDRIPFAELCAALTLFSALSQVQLGQVGRQMPPHQARAGSVWSALTGDLRVLLGSPLSRAYMACSVLLGASCIPMQIVIAREALGLDADGLVLLFAAGSLVAMGANAGMARMSRTWGEQRVFAISIGGVAACSIAVAASLSPWAREIPSGGLLTLQLGALLLSNVFVTGVAMFWFSTSFHAVGREQTASGLMVFGLCFDGAAVLTGTAAAAALGASTALAGLFPAFLLVVALVALAAGTMTHRFQALRSAGD